MLPIIENFQGVPSSSSPLCVPTASANVSKGYRSVISRPVLFPFLEDWGKVSLPPIFRNYSRFYRFIENKCEGRSELF